MNAYARELIDDREVAGLDEDRLGHDEVATQLAELVCSVPTPSNVALYGPWGSGKSGIGNLLSTKLEDKNGVEFVRFDAFKYAENPLRRNFVSVVATALDIKEPRFHDDLYRGQTTTDFVVPVRKLFSLLGIFAIVVLVAVIVSSAAIAIVASFQGKDVFEELLRIGTTTLPASLVPASLLTAVIALVGKTFTSEKRVERAESDEEFENLLTDLVRKSGAKRVVIFVDELDRCSSDEVVETLNAVRTFLGVDRCVFVVAADQQVLERALTDSLSQPTPVDSLNPYYSAGSAYLDKVFQYQVQVPPLMPQSIVNFVVNLLEGRPGVWQQIDVPVVVSILVPSHVRSPRRVKNLLNAFVLNFRLAEGRVESKQLDLDVLESVDELARLVCLRVEFPLFARDLVVDPALSEYVRELAESTESPATMWQKYPYVDDGTRRIAEGYANTQRPVDRLLLDDDDSSSQAVRSVQGQQLLDYLRRTRSVSGPTKALIHLQNTGSLFGLPSAVAEQFERDAQNASLSGVSKTFGGLDAVGRAAAIQLLVQQARAAVGLEAPNISFAILAAVASDPNAAEPFANEIALVVSTALGESAGLLSALTASGAWEIAIAGNRPEADILGMLVLDSDLAATDDDLFQRLVLHGKKAANLSTLKTSELVVHRLLVEDPDFVVDSILATEADQRTPLLEAAENALTTQLTDAITEFAAVRAAREEAEAAAATARTAGRAPAVVEVDDDEEETYDPGVLLSALDRLLEELDGNDMSASIVLRVLLKVGKKESREVVEKHVGSITPRDAEIAALVLEQAVLCATELWPLWLDSWPSGEFATHSRSAKALVNLARTMWQRASDPAAVLADGKLMPAAQSLARLVDSAENSVRAQILEVVVLDEFPEGDDEVEAHLHRVDVATVLGQTGVISQEDLARKRAEAVIMSLRAELEEAEPESPLSEWVLDEVAVLLEEYYDLLDPRLRSLLIEAAATDTWLSEFDELRLRVRFLGRSDVSEVPAVTAASVRDSESGMSKAAFLDLLERWLRGTEEKIDEVLPVLRRTVPSASPTVLSAVTIWRAKQAPNEQYMLLESFISNEKVGVQPQATLRALGLNSVDEASVASLVVDRYRRSTTNENRRSTLQLAQHASLSGASARKRIVLETIVPMLELNASSADIAMTYALRLAKPFAPGTKKLLGDAIVAAGSRFSGVTK